MLASAQSSAGVITIEDTIFICEGRDDGESCAGEFMFSLDVPTVPSAVGPGIVGARLFGNFQDDNAFASITSPEFPAFAANIFEGSAGPNYDQVRVIDDLGAGGFSVPSEFINLFSGSTFGLAKLEVSDGVLSRDVDTGAPAFVTLTFTYETAEQVPAPATVLLLVTGLLAIRRTYV